MACLAEIQQLHIPHFQLHSTKNFANAFRFTKLTDLDARFTKMVELLRGLLYQTQIGGVRGKYPLLPVVTQKMVRFILLPRVLFFLSTPMKRLPADRALQRAVAASPAAPPYLRGHGHELRQGRP